MYILGSVFWFAAYGGMIGCYMAHFKLALKFLVFYHAEGVKLVHVLSYSLVIFLLTWYLLNVKTI